MPHVTFIHGISNKPPAGELSRLWLDTLADQGLDLESQGVSSSMVYWADLLYPAPLREAEYESAGDPELEDLPDVGTGWIARAGDEEADFIRKLAAGIGYHELDTDDQDPTDEAVAGSTGFERVPLPWFIKRRLMKILLRDVHHYLFDAEFSPRPGIKHRIQHDIRERAVEVMRRGAEQPGPHVIIAHSLGTVIAYDCLKRVEDSPTVDALITVGSPLGIDEIQDRLRPQWTRASGFPSERVRLRWVNVYDRLDPVAGLDPVLGNDYRHRDISTVEDIHEPNWGRWRHSITKYLAGRRLRESIAHLLELDRGRDA